MMNSLEISKSALDFDPDTIIIYWVQDFDYVFQSLLIRKIHYRHHRQTLVIVLIVDFILDATDGHIVKHVTFFYLQV